MRACLFREFLYCFILLVASIAPAFAAETQPETRPATAPATLVVQVDGGAIMIPEAPTFSGVMFLQQGDWPEDVIKAFHETRWLGGASIRLTWRDFEPQDQQFNWAPMDKVLGEVRKYNEAHPDAQRVMQMRLMAGVWCPKWFEAKGVKFYDTWVERMNGKKDELRVPKPFDNPEFLKQMREAYRALYERYGNAPEVVTYHGTWTAGPWAELFHPKDGAPLPEGYTRDKFLQGCYEQIDVLIEEICSKGKAVSMPFTGHQPKKEEFDIQGYLTKYITKRLGRRTPFFYVNINSWGSIYQWIAKPNEGKDVFDLNYAYQALGTNASGGGPKQGDWLPLVKIAKDNKAQYVEVYTPDVVNLDVKNHIVEAFTQTQEEAAKATDEALKGFVGYLPWLKENAATMYFRGATVTKEYVSASGNSAAVAGITLESETPEETSITARARTRSKQGEWSEWRTVSEARQLPQGDQLEVEITLRTDDGWKTPVIKGINISGDWKEAE